MTLQPLDAEPVTLSIDLSGFARAFTRMREVIAQAALTIGRWAAHLTEWLREHANDPVRVAGLEGRYAVRGGLDPAYSTPEGIDRLVQMIMAGDGEHRGDRALRLLTSENRSLIAAAAIRGWCYSYGDGPAILAWHRLMGTTVVVVGRG